MVELRSRHKLYLISLDISSMTERSCWYLVWEAGSRAPLVEGMEREAGPGGTSITVRKTAYCDTHTPADSDATPKLDDVAALGISTPNSKKRSPKKNANEQHPLPILFRGLMNFSPQCPWDKVQKISTMVHIDKKSQFIQRLMAYWTLKRQTRNGVPLIR